MATLDIRTVKNGECARGHLAPHERITDEIEYQFSDRDLFPLFVKVNEGEEMIVCNLGRANFPHSPVDLNFEKGMKVSFWSTGTAAIHLTGKLTVILRRRACFE